MRAANKLPAYPLFLQPESLIFFGGRRSGTLQSFVRKGCLYLKDSPDLGRVGLAPSVSPGGQSLPCINRLIQHFELI